MESFGNLGEPVLLLERDGIASMDQMLQRPLRGQPYEQE
jgi:hypothetical protein